MNIVNLFLLPQNVPNWEFMWMISFGIYGLLKVLSWSVRNASAPIGRNLAYLFVWPGMDVDAFLSDREVASPLRSEWMFAAIKFMSGIILVGVTSSSRDWCGDTIAGWIGMIGIVFTLHFGLFHLLSCYWRTWGIDAKPIMNWPIVSTGLAEFWGRRWNLAFRDLTHRFLFRPLSRRIGATNALLVGFLISGLIHELAISWPADGGWGKPTLFFSLQGAGIVIERSRWGRSIGLGQSLYGRLFCVLLLVIPSSLLFHGPFVTRVILPFLVLRG
jgi:hypothetical protein